MTSFKPLPNPRLQRTRAPLPLQSVRGETSSLGGARRAPLSRKPLGRGGQVSGPGFGFERCRHGE